MTTAVPPADPAPDFTPVDWPEVESYPSSAEKLGPLWQVLWSMLGRTRRPVRSNLISDMAAKELEKTTGLVVSLRTSDALLYRASEAGVIGRVKLPNRGPRVRADTAEVWHYYRLDRYTA